MQDNRATQTISVNGRTYAVPQRPVAVICIDGFDPDYLAVGLAKSELPGFARIARDGFAGEALASASPTPITAPSSPARRHRCMASPAISIWTAAPARR
jgi:phosphonoacetate hydrolase